MAQKRNTHNRAQAFFKKEGSILAWLASAVIILLFTNAITMQHRLDVIGDKADAATPKANQSIGIMKFTWQDDRQVSADLTVVRVSVEILNLQSQAIVLTPSSESYITDASGARFTSVSAPVASPLKAGIYGPQTAAIGDMAYGIPADIHDAKWCYELAPTAGGGEPVCVAMNKYSQN